jgi:hypothetical protein
MIHHHGAGGEIRNFTPSMGKVDGEIQSNVTSGLNVQNQEMSF